MTLSWPLMALLSFCLLCLTILPGALAQWIDYPPTGQATLTHYDLPRGYIAACGCNPETTHYPVAALSQMAFGSSANYGPGCGKCFNLTLVNPLIATPPFYPEETKHIVVKIADLCPLSGDGWCSGTRDKTNSGGSHLNFDLAYPSAAIPKDFFPHNETLYGYKDFGVWNITYAIVPCLESWEGRSNQRALGSVPALGSSGCCPADPTGNSNDTCPSYSDANGLPPDTRVGSASMQQPSILLYLSTLLVLGFRT